MSRLVSVVVLASLCVGPVACKKPKGVDVDPRQLIPADADAVIGFRLDPVRSSPLGAAIGGAMRTDRDLSAVMDAAVECKVALEPLGGFVAGKIDGESFLGVIEAPGIGDEDLVKCIETEARERTGEKTGFFLFETRGDVSVTPQEGGGYLIILNKDAIAVVDRTWEDAVFAAIAEPSKRNTETALAKALAELDAKTHLWIAALVSETAAAELGDFEGGEGLRTVTASVDLSQGIGLATRLGFTDAEKAGAFRTTLPEAAKAIAPSLGEVGLPTNLLDALKVAGEGPVVTADLQISADAAPGIVSTVAMLAAAP